MAKCLAKYPTKSTKHMEEDERAEGIEQMLKDLLALAHNDGCIAAAWTVEWLGEWVTSYAKTKQHIPWRPEGAEYIEFPCLISKGGFESERVFKLEDGCSGVCNVTYCTPEHGPGFVLALVVKRLPERVVVTLPDGFVRTVDVANLT